MDSDPWFDSWLERHLERHPRRDWDAQGAEFWKALQSIVDRNHVREAVAEDASGLMAEEWDGFPNSHHREFLKAVRRVWAHAEGDFSDRNPILRWRADAAASMAVDGEAAAAWDALPPDRRRAIEAQVRLSKPWHAKRPYMFRCLCLAVMCETNHPRSSRGA